MNSKDKFTAKVADYVKYRPAYPPAFLNYLICDVGLSKASAVADIGAGTGIFTRLLAEIAGIVYAVEPNLPMRTACTQHCSGMENVMVMDGSAEDTGLPAASVDFITSAQAFHWFNKLQAKAEFLRILKPEGMVILVWNRRDHQSGLVQEHDAVNTDLCPSYQGFSGDLRPDALDDFFRGGYCDYREFPNDLHFTLEAYLGYCQSASYAPSPNDAHYQTWIDRLTQVFRKYSQNGILHMPMNTCSYAGTV